MTASWFLLTTSGIEPAMLSVAVGSPDGAQWQDIGAIARMGTEQDRGPFPQESLPVFIPKRQGANREFIADPGFESTSIQPLKIQLSTTDCRGRGSPGFDDPEDERTDSSDAQSEEDPRVTSTERGLTNIDPISSTHSSLRVQSASLKSLRMSS
jgi:hypothetical protein